VPTPGTVKVHNDSYCKHELWLTPGIENVWFQKISIPPTDGSLVFTLHPLGISLPEGHLWTPHPPGISNFFGGGSFLN